MSLIAAAVVAATFTAWVVTEYRHERIIHRADWQLRHDPTYAEPFHAFADADTVTGRAPFDLRAEDAPIGRWW